MRGLRKKIRLSIEQANRLQKRCGIGFLDYWRAMDTFPYKYVPTDEEFVRRVATLREYGQIKAAEAREVRQNDSEAL